MKLYGVVRNIYKNNSVQPLETIIDKFVFRDEQAAFNYARHEADATSLRYGYKLCEPLLAIEEQKNSRTQKSNRIKA